MQTSSLRKTIKTKSAQDIADHIEANCKRNNVFTLTLVLCQDGDGYEVGIADKDQNGYTATGLKVDMPRWDDANEIVDEANLILFPARSKRENAMIQLSTMRSTHSI